MGTKTLRDRAEYYLMRSEYYKSYCELLQEAIYESADLVYIAFADAARKYSELISSTLDQINIRLDQIKDRDVYREMVRFQSELRGRGSKDAVCFKLDAKDLEKAMENARRYSFMVNKKTIAAEMRLAKAKEQYRYWSDRRDAELSFANYGTE